MPPEHAASMRAQALYDSWPSYIWPDNHDAVRTYCACQWSIHCGMGGAWYQGIAAPEILAVCTLLGIKKKQRAKVLYGVKIMVDEAQPILQSRVGK